MMAATSADVPHALRVFMILMFLYNVILCGICEKSEEINIILETTFDGNRELLYCQQCKPNDPEVIEFFNDDTVQAFLNSKGMKILHQNVNGCL